MSAQQPAGSGCAWSLLRRVGCPAPGVQDGISGVGALATVCRKHHDVHGQRRPPTLSILCPSFCRKALTRYQMLFRHMFYCKHVERQLCTVWIGNKAAKQYSPHAAKWCVPRRAGRPAHGFRMAAWHRL